MSTKEDLSKGNKWLRIGFTLLLGLFVAYLDRSNLSIGISSMDKALGVSASNAAVDNSLVLTIFLIGYAFANFFGGLLTYRFSPKTIVVLVIFIWSAATFLTGWVSSIALLLAYRLILGVAEGVYWPQQSRFAESWFKPSELTRANALIQYYGEFLSLAIGFAILTPIYNAFGWKPLFWVTGLLGLVVIVPLYIKLLKDGPNQEVQKQKQARQKLTLKSLGGPTFILVVFSYFANGMLFWGITLWIPLAVKSFGFHGLAQGFASGLPYMAAVIFAIPMMIISDRIQKRTLIAALGLIVAGILLVFLPEIHSAGGKLTFISLAVGVYASFFSPNIWSIIISSVDSVAVGPASGIVNGIGAGLGGTVAGWVVGLLLRSTGSYLPGFIVLGVIAVAGGASLLIYGRIKLDSRRVTEIQNTQSV